MKPFRKRSRHPEPPPPDPVALALAYPYVAPDFDFVLRGRHAGAVNALSDADREGRVPILAFGSNRSAEQLARKFGDMPDAAVPVERARLSGFDIVHAAHIARFGAIAATLLESPGTTVEVSITWLAPALLPIMHRSEGAGRSYDYVRLDGIALKTLAGGARDSVMAYLSRSGALTIDGAPRALAASVAEGRSFAPLDQRGAQEAAMAKLGVIDSIKTFIRENLRDEELRHERERLLAADARKLDSPGITVLPI